MLADVMRHLQGHTRRYVPQHCNGFRSALHHITWVQPYTQLSVQQSPHRRSDLSESTGRQIQTCHHLLSVSATGYNYRTSLSYTQQRRHRKQHSGPCTLSYSQRHYHSLCQMAQSLEGRYLPGHGARQWYQPGGNAAYESLAERRLHELDARLQLLRLTGREPTKNPHRTVAVFELLAVRRHFIANCVDCAAIQVATDDYNARHHCHRIYDG